MSTSALNGTSPSPTTGTALVLSSFSDTTPVLIDADSGPLSLCVDDVLKYIAPGAPRHEALLFLMTCKAMRINPLVKEAFLVPQKDKWATVVAKAGYLKAAQRHDSYDGHEAGIVGQPYDASKVKAGSPPPYTGPPVDFDGSLLPGGFLLVGGWAKVWRKGVGRPITSRVSMQEYSRNSPGPWQTLTATMIRKVALVAALREAFSLSGYDESEMPAAHPEQPARTFTATVVTPTLDAPAGADMVAGYSFRPAPVAIASVAHEVPVAAPLAERASAEQVARVNELFDLVGASDYARNQALTRRGVDRVVDLAATDARDIIDKLVKKLDAASGPDELAARIAGATRPAGPDTDPAIVAEVARQEGEDPDEVRFCSVCRDRQKFTTSGWTCANGHGGAPPIGTDGPSPDDMPAPDVDADGFGWATGTTPAERAEGRSAEADPDQEEYQQKVAVMERTARAMKKGRKPAAGEAAEPAVPTTV